MEKEKPKYRIGNFAIAVLLSLTAVADLLSLIPFVGTFVAPIFWILTSIYLWHAKCGLLNARRLATSLISMIAEMIPVVQEFPLTLAGIIAVIIMVRIEDKTGISIPTVSKGKGLVNDGVRSPQTRPAPLNQGGRRMPS